MFITQMMRQNVISSSSNDRVFVGVRVGFSGPEWAQIAARRLARAPRVEQKNGRDPRVCRVPCISPKAEPFARMDIFSGSGVQEVRYAGLIEREMMLAALRA
jgi:hypothetical protein